VPNHRRGPLQRSSVQPEPDRAASRWRIYERRFDSRTLRSVRADRRNFHSRSPGDHARTSVACGTILISAFVLSRGTSTIHNWGREPDGSPSPPWNWKSNNSNPDETGGTDLSAEHNVQLCAAPGIRTLSQESTERRLFARWLSANAVTLCVRGRSGLGAVAAGDGTGGGAGAGCGPYWAGRPSASGCARR